MQAQRFPRLVTAVLCVTALVMGTETSAATGFRGPVRDQSQTAQKPLTNADVEAMVKAGMPDAVIVSAIRRAPEPLLDTSPAALVALTEAGASEAVLLAVLDPGSTPAPDPVVGGTDIRGPADKAVTVLPAGLPDAPGIYMEEHAVPGLYRPLEPTTFSQSKVGGTFLTAMTFGLAKAQWRAVVRSPSAVLRTSDQQPTFYFVFDAANGSTRPFAGWFATASSPNEFVLVQMFAKDDRRELVVGEFNAYSASTGTRSKDTVPLEIKRIAQGIYKVTIAEPLGPGEFCFFYASGLPGVPGGQTGRLFDFGVDPPQ